MIGTPNVEKLKRRGDVPKLVRATDRRHDESVRRAAAQALGEVGGPEVMPVLVEVMAADVCPVAGPAAVSVAGLDAAGGRVPVEDLVAALRASRRWHRRGEQPCSCRWAGDLFWQTRQVLGRRAGSDHVPLMLELLEEDDVHLREIAAHVLKDIGDERAVDPLVARLERESYDQAPHQVVFDAIASFERPDTLDVLLRRLAGTPPLSSHGSYLGYRHEVDALVAFDPPGLDRRLAELIATSTSPRQREVLYEAVAERLGSPDLARAAADRAERADRRAPLDRALAAGPKGLKSLVGFLDAKDAEHRQGARRGLRALDAPDLYGVLIRLLAHEDPDNQRFAVAELGRRRDGRAVFPLIDLHRRDPSLRQATGKSLARLGVTDIADHLLAALRGADARARALARLKGDRRAVEPLRRMVSDPRLGYHIRCLAQARLADLGEGDPVPQPLTDTDPAADDLRARCAELLRSTLGELRIGRDMGRTPYRIETWEKDRRQVLMLPAGTAPPPVPGGELPEPRMVGTSSHGRHLFQESFESHDQDNDMWLTRWRTLGYHWDFRKPTVGAYFAATVNEDGLVAFHGGLQGRYPADPDGWRAVVADMNDFSYDLHIKLWAGSYS